MITSKSLQSQSLYRLGARPRAQDRIQGFPGARCSQDAPSREKPGGRETVGTPSLERLGAAPSRTSGLHGSALGFHVLTEVFFSPTLRRVKTSLTEGPTRSREGRGPGLCHPHCRCWQEFCLPAGEQQKLPQVLSLGISAGVFGGVEVAGEHRGPPPVRAEFSTTFAG